jgi:hypothetical protein
MINYAYWFIIIIVIALVLFAGGFKAGYWKTALSIALIILVAGWSAYAFHFQQIFVKRYGGEMTIKTPEGQYHLGVTWKEDNMWIETYDPKTNTCIFSEYSKGNLLQGRVYIKDCNPLLPQATGYRTYAPAGN